MIRVQYILFDTYFGNFTIEKQKSKNRQIRAKDVIAHSSTIHSSIWQLTYDIIITFFDLACLYAHYAQVDNLCIVCAV